MRVRRRFSGLTGMPLHNLRVAPSSKERPFSHEIPTFSDDACYLNKLPRSAFSRALQIPASLGMTKNSDTLRSIFYLLPGRVKFRSPDESERSGCLPLAKN